MSLFIFSADNITSIPSPVKKEITNAAKIDIKILVANGSSMHNIIKEFIPETAINSYTCVADAMSHCDKAIVLWDLRERATGIAIDQLSGLHTPTRIYDMILNKWC